MAHQYQSKVAVNFNPGLQTLRQNTSPNYAQVSYWCSYCSQSFFSYQALKLHVGKIHTEKYKEFIDCHERNKNHFEESTINYYNDQTLIEYINTKGITEKGKSALSPEEQSKSKSFLSHRESEDQRLSSLHGNSKKMKMIPTSKASIPPKVKVWSKFFTLPDSESHTVNSSPTAKSSSTPQAIANRLPLSANANIPDSVPEPIGILILCTFCQEKFYDPKYLSWHIHLEHENKPDPSEAKKSAENPFKTHAPDSKKSPTKSIAVGQSERRKNSSSNSSLLQNQSHVAMSSSGEYNCNLCAKTFSNPDNLKRHISMHQGQKVLTCKICPQRCVNIQHLREHQLKFHSDVYVFSISGSEITQGKSAITPSRDERRAKNKRKLSQDSDNDELQVKVPTTSKSKSKINRKGKGNIVTGKIVEQMNDNSKRAKKSAMKEVYHCPFCKFTVRSLSEVALKDHVRSKHHESGSPLMGNSTCKHCNYKAKYPLDILRHIRSHDEEKVFSCKFCSKRFREYEPKRKHERKHSDNAETFPCPYCDKFYFHAQSLTRHMGEFHPIE